jgi:tetratricopeptide (TPR) repeat protein
MRTVVTFFLLSALMAAQSQSDAATVMRRGAELVNKNQLAAAQDLYEKALSVSPDDPDLRFELGMVFFREREWSKAIENYSSSLRNRPGKIKPLFYLAQAYFMQPDMEHALQTIQQAATLAPNDAQVCQKYGEYLSATIETRKDGLSWLEKARRLNPNLPRIDFEIGRTQFQLTDYESAAVNFDAGLTKDATDGEDAFYLAESAANLGYWEKARSSYNYALTHGYTKGPAYYGLGRSELELGNFEAAIEPLQRAVSAQPSLTKAHFQMAKAYRQLNRTRDAESETRLFAALADRVDTSRELAGSEEEQAWKQAKPLLEANKEQQALELLATLPVSNVPGHDDPHYLIGTMYYSMGRNADAKRALIIARNKNPKSAPTAAYLGMVELSAGEVAAAEGSFQTALTLDSSDTLALIGMGGIRYQQQRWPDVITYLEKSRTADPDTLFLLCDAYYRVGDGKQAALIAEVIRALGSDKKPLLDRLEKLAAPHQN